MSTATLEAPPAVKWPTDRLVTGEELLNHPEWGNCELIRGKVVQVCRPNFEHGVLAAEITFHLRTWSGAKKLGYVASNDSGVFIDHDPDTVRGPDVYFIRGERRPIGRASKGFLDTAPDLCVEIVSPHDKSSELSDKIAQFLAMGVSLIWVIDPKKRTAQVIRQNGTTALIASNGMLTGENILPGFELPLKDLFAALD
ncbi:MAG: Uma2 family endonuclease [Planctomycetota bacterium]